MSKKLSNDPKFSESIILKMNYSSNPSSSGKCEVALLKHTTAYEIWFWDENYEAELLHKSDLDLGWRHIIKLLLQNSPHISTFLDEIKISRKKAPIGEFLAIATCDDETAHIVAEILLQLPDETLLLLSKKNLITNDEFHNAFYPHIDLLIEGLVDINEIFSGIILNNLSDDELIKAIESRLEREEAINEENHNLRDHTLAPFASDILLILGNYCKDKPTTRFYSGNLPPYGRERLRRYIEEYVIKNGMIPSGVHLIPSGAEPHTGKVGLAFDVDFDQLVNLK